MTRLFARIALPTLLCATFACAEAPPPPTTPTAPVTAPAVAEEEARPEEPVKADAAGRVAVDRPGADWPQFLGPTSNSNSAETGILTAWPKTGLKKLWDCPLGLGYAPPAVAAGRLYHFDRVGDAARLTCRNATTGEVIWRHESPTEYQDLYGYDPGPRASPLVDGERVYTYGADGVLECVTAAKGEPVWRLDTREKYRFHQNFFGVGSAPLVFGELLIVAVGGSPKGPRPADLRDARGNGTGIVALDKKTGAVKYTLSDELASYASPLWRRSTARRSASTSPAEACSASTRAPASNSSSTSGARRCLKASTPPTPSSSVTRSC